MKNQKTKALYLYDQKQYDEAAAVTAIGTVFKGNSVITAFNELAYFTGLTSIVERAFLSDVNLKSIVIPDGLRRGALVQPILTH